MKESKRNAAPKEIPRIDVLQEIKKKVYWTYEYSNHVYFKDNATL